MRVFLVLTLLFISACGQDAGTNPPPAQPYAQVVEVCTELRAEYPDYILKTRNGVFMVEQDDECIELTRLQPGYYTTSDGRNCQVLITKEFNVSDSNF